MLIKKFNGRGSVIISLNSDTTVRGIDYKKGDIISIFSDVDVSVGYKIDNKKGEASKNVLSYSKYSASTLIIHGVTNTEELNGLLYSNELESETGIKIEHIPYAEGTHYIATDKSILEVKVFSPNEKVGYTFDESNRSIQFDKKYKNVKIVSTLSIKGTKLELKKPEIGYVNITVVIEGFFGENKEFFSYNIPTASLVTDPQFDFSDSSYATDLVFDIINGSEDTELTTYEL